MMEDTNKIVIKDDEGNEIELFVLEATKINGAYYILTTDAQEDEDGECYILKDVSKPEDAEAVYQFVENEDELNFVGKIFAELMEDTEVVFE
ncbi:MAG: DUF1292 domain-containing protein [Lachnospiraceae bacterium]|nr:DUF1292 domain-containing protein [Candidatus Darwinimomas equi]